MPAVYALDQTGSSETLIIACKFRCPRFLASPATRLSRYRPSWANVIVSSSTVPPLNCCISAVSVHEEAYLLVIYFPLTTVQPMATRIVKVRGSSCQLDASAVSSMRLQVGQPGTTFRSAEATLPMSRPGITVPRRRCRSSTNLTGRLDVD